MVWLVVVDGARVLRPQLRVVEVDVGRSEELFGEADEVGMECQAVQIPRLPRPRVKPGELALRVLLVG